MIKHDLEHFQCLTIQTRAPEWLKGAFKYLDTGGFGALRSYSLSERGGSSPWINHSFGNVKSIASTAGIMGYLDNLC